MKLIQFVFSPDSIECFLLVALVLWKLFNFDTVYHLIFYFVILYSILAFKHFDFKLTKDYRSSKRSPGGIYLCLLPIALLSSKYSQNEIEFSLCLTLSSLLFWINKHFNSNLWKGFKILHLTIIVLVFISYLTQIFFRGSIQLAFILLLLYYFSYLLEKIPLRFPSTFSFGESALLLQALFALIFSYIGQIISKINVNDVTFETLMIFFLKHSFLSIILSMELNHRRGTHSFTTFVFLNLFLHLTLFWFFDVFHFIKSSSQILVKNIVLIAYWSFCFILAVLFMGFIFLRNQNSSEFSPQKFHVFKTCARKYFHFLGILVFLPGLIFQPFLLSVVVSLVFILFLCLEYIRYNRFGWPATMLESALGQFKDSQDAGPLILTHIYLLINCVLPLFLIPPDSTGTDSGLRKLEVIQICGILSLGVGDAFASLCGSRFGKHKWPDSNKSIEGTVASIIAQIFFYYLLLHAGLVAYVSFFRILYLVSFPSILEASTSQTDNLILVLYAFCLFQ